MALEFTDANFQKEVIESNVPVLVDFWAVWCGPCKIIAPFVEEISKEYEGRVKVGKVDVDNNPDVSMRYGIRSIPTLMIFRDGKVVDQIIGAVPKNVITQKLDAQLQPA